MNRNSTIFNSKSANSKSPSAKVIPFRSAPLAHKPPPLQRPVQRPQRQSRSRHQPLQARPEGMLPITAPLLGTFYVAPEPGAPPFVKVGQQITEDTTVGLIEVMKVFNSVRAAVSGTIVEVVAQNGQFVEFGQTLFIVKP
jgi:acetyl-CoA carboxylase biotin carboxyl carrier protein